MSSVQSQNDHASHHRDDAALPLREYWAIVRKRLWVILFVAGVVVGLAAVYVYNQPDVYKAEVIVEINTDVPQVLGDVQPVVDPAAGARYWSTAEYYETQYRIIRSRSVAEAVVVALQLGENLEFLGIDPSQSPDEIAHALARVHPVDSLMSRTIVEAIPESHLVSVSIEHTNPQLAMEMANAIAIEYVERNEERQLASTDEAFRWLESEREQLRDHLQVAENHLLDYRQDNGINTASLTDRQTHLSNRLQSLSGLRDEAQAEVRELRASRRRVRQARRAEDPISVTLGLVIESDLIQRLKQDRQELQTELSHLVSEYGERHEGVIGARLALAHVEEALVFEIAAILETFDEQLDRAEARDEYLAEQIEGVETELRSLTDAEPRYNQLARDIAMQSEILTLIERRHKETDLYRRQRDVNNIAVLDAAILPDSPIRPRRRMVLAASVLMGLIFGLALAMGLELLDNTVRTQEQIERELGFTFLGVVPSVKRELQNAIRRKKMPVDALPDLHIHHNPKSSVAECCRSIRTNLHFMSPDRELHRILVTSASPREGKTSTAINIATVMAQSNHKVLIVDTDLRRPRMHRAFGLAGRIGLTNLILGEVDFDTAITETEVPGLHLLPCGSIPPNPTELMHTDRFRKIIDELSDRYDRVIFDSPPVIAVADAMILGNAVDGVLFVVKSGHTAKEVVRKAKSLLTGTNAPILGAVLNDLELEDRAYRYHYYYKYYHRYGQYYEESPEAAEDAQQTS